MHWAGLLVVCIAFQTVTPGKFQRRITKTVSGNYLLYVPDTYKPGGRDRYPLMLFLHGIGERGADLGKLKVHGPFKEIAKGRKFPFIIVAPQMPLTETNWDVDRLTALLDDIESKYRVDKAREYVTGISMGGFGTWALAAATPSRFAAAVPICGGGNFLTVMALKSLPIWAIHGDHDPAVPIALDRSMVDTVKRAGGDITFTVIKGGLHDVWTPYYSGTELYDWLLRHRR
ncbi:MAG: prolyl oligopeptidase family serine peptidase [Fimbriimonadales bacterium]